jgi:hypothetical protein
MRLRATEHFNVIIAPSGTARRGRIYGFMR